MNLAIILFIIFNLKFQFSQQQQQLHKFDQIKDDVSATRFAYQKQIERFKLNKNGEFQEYIFCYLISSF